MKFKAKYNGGTWQEITEGQLHSDLQGLYGSVSPYLIDLLMNGYLITPKAIYSI